MKGITYEAASWHCMPCHDTGTQTPATLIVTAKGTAAGSCDRADHIAALKASIKAATAARQAATFAPARPHYCADGCEPDTAALVRAAHAFADERITPTWHRGFEVVVSADGRPSLISTTERMSELKTWVPASDWAAVWACLDSLEADARSHERYMRGRG